MSKQDLPVLERSPLLGMYVLSDVHIDTLSNEDAQRFAAGLEQIKEIPWPADALLIGGDNAATSQQVQLENFYKILEEHSPLEKEKVLVALGNHDVRGQRQHWSNSPEANTPYWEKAKDCYLHLNRAYQKDQTKVYFDAWINEYHFIVLNTEKGLKDSAYLSSEQLDWLEQTIAEKAEYGKPIFLLVHQPLVDTHWRSNLLEGFGHSDQRVKKILRAYPQTVVFSGHIHNGFGYASMVHRPYGTSVDIPSYNYTEVGVTDKGTGWYVAVYREELQCYPINLLEKKWYPEHYFSVPLPTLPVVYAKAAATERKSEELEGLLVRTQELLELAYYQDPDKHYTDLTPPPQILFTPSFYKTQEIMAQRLLRESKA